jgi:hypothetical protein
MKRIGRLISGPRGLVGLLGLACGLLLTGCGGGASNTQSAADVKGKVTYNNAPVTGYKLVLRPKQGAGENRLDLKPDGTFNGTQVTSPGTKIVYFEKEPPVANPTAGRTGKAKENYNVPETEKTQVTKIPAKYTTPNSGLTWDLKAGPNEKNFDHGQWTKRKCG